MMMQQRKFSRKRKRKTTVIKNIVFGNISFYRGKKINNKEDYVWCCYVRSAEKDENGKLQPLHQFIRKVVFTLHESFPNNVIEIEKPPFSIVRNGWGEFEVNITIYFQDINEEPVTKIHGIQIFHPNQNQRATIKKPVVNENYDEIVFNEPAEFFYHMLVDDPEETFKNQFINPIPDPSLNKIEEKPVPKEETKEIEDKKEETGGEKKEEKDKDEVMDEKKEDEKDKDVEMKDEEKAEGEGKEEEKEEEEYIEFNSTYEVKVGANNEHTVDVTGFFEEHNDKNDAKLLTDTLKHLREETEYLRNQIRDAEREILEKKEKCKEYEQ